MYLERLRPIRTTVWSPYLDTGYKDVYTVRLDVISRQEKKHIYDMKLNNICM